MAQGIRRPGRHSRQPSRFAALVNGGESYQHDERPPKKYDEATVSYIKRTLCSQRAEPGTPTDAVADDYEAKSLEELLPPLTSSNDIDVELYALIAVVLNLFVQSWYNRITPDQDFAKEVILIIAHCTRGLEQRLRGADLESLLLDELPAVLNAHIDAVETARRNSQTAERDICLLYHTLRPHNALTPVPISVEQATEQQENESAWCQIVVNHVLSLLLPPEDLHNPCLQVLVSEVLSEMIVHNGVCNKACEGWLIWEGVTKAIYAAQPNLAPVIPAKPQYIDRLERFGLLSTSGSLAEQNARRPGLFRFDRISSAFWAALQLLSLIWVCTRSFVAALTQASTLSARSSQNLGGKNGEDRDRITGADKGSEARFDEAEELSELTDIQPILGLEIWTCIAQLTRLQNHMPWLTGLLSLMRWLLLFGPGQVCYTDSRLDRLISHSIRSRLLDPALLPSVLRAVRNAIFPENALSQSRTPPSSDEVIAIRRECAEAVIGALPGYVRSKFFATDDVESMRDDVEDILNIFADPYINKHLVISIVELLVVRLFPETMEH